MTKGTCLRTVTEPALLLLGDTCLVAQIIVGMSFRVQWEFLHACWIAWPRIPFRVFGNGICRKHNRVPEDEPAWSGSACAGHGSPVSIRGAGRKIPIGIPLGSGIRRLLRQQMSRARELRLPQFLATHGSSGIFWLTLFPCQGQGNPSRRRSNRS